MTVEEADGGRSAGIPSGEVYDWYQRGLGLLANGDPAAAVQLLGHAAEAEPGSRSVREALARAQFDAGLVEEARASFAAILLADPVDDYARYGLGRSLQRLGELPAAAEQLALAVAMRPASTDYAGALRQVRATLAARRDADG